MPPHLQQLYRSTIDQSHYYRNVWYWGGEAKLRVEGEKMELTSTAARGMGTGHQRRQRVLGRDRSDSPRAAAVVEIFKNYASNMEKAGYPYR